MIDIAKLLLKAGDGGHGRVSFRREKYIPKGGPDGGDGGKGGDIILQADAGLATLANFAGKTEFIADKGQYGGKKSKIGSAGEDLILKVPVGTTIWLIGENEISRKNRVFSHHFRRKMEQYTLEKEGQAIPKRPADEIALVQIENSTNKDDLEKLLEESNLTQVNLEKVPKLKLIELDHDGQQYLVAKGGKGGKGNQRFANSKLQVPLIAEYGELGEKKLVVMEQKLLADIGLVGFPNAGKSTLISVVTSARPKIDSYPFTTLEPQLGVINWQDKQAVIADIPGLIEGASEGKGLGYSFLRHVENSKVLAFVLSLDEAVVFDESMSLEQKSQVVWEQYQALQQELANYKETLADKKQLIVINKSDIYNSELIEAIKTVFDQHDLQVSFISALTHQGLDEFRQLVLSVL